MISSDIKVKVNISNDLVESNDGRTHGITKQGSLSKKNNFGQTYDKKNNMRGITEATITLYEGSIKASVAVGSGYKYEGLTLEQGIGAVAGHEIVHATDENEINKDLQELYGTPRKDDGEEKPNKVGKTITEQSLLINTIIEYFFGY